MQATAALRIARRAANAPMPARLKWAETGPVTKKGACRSGVSRHGGDGEPTDRGSLAERPTLQPTPQRKGRRRTWGIAMQHEHEGCLLFLWLFLARKVHWLGKGGMMRRTDFRDGPALTKWLGSRDTRAA